MSDSSGWLSQNASFWVVRSFLIPRLNMGVGVGGAGQSRPMPGGGLPPTILGDVGGERTTELVLSHTSGRTPGAGARTGTG